MVICVSAWFCDLSERADWLATIANSVCSSGIEVGRHTLMFKTNPNR